MEKLKISAVVITKNEEKNIERCLKSLSFIEDVIVFDSESTDQTVPLAKKYTSQVFSSPFEGYGNQKNKATEHTRFDFVFYVDADEEISSPLKEELIRLFENEKKPTFNAVMVPRKNYYLNRWITHGSWYPNYLLRLARKNDAQWSNDLTHESLKAKGEILYLKNPLLHYSFKSIHHHLEKMNGYTSKEADEDSESFSLGRLVFKPFGKFLEEYLFKKAFLDGIPGFILAVMAGFSTFLKYAKRWEKRRILK